MSSIMVSIQYAGMRATAQQFTESAAKVQKINSDILQVMDKLKKGSWLSEAATRWYQEMDNDVLPGIKRLVEALQRSSQAAAEFAQTMKSAEEEAGGCLPSF